MRWSELPKVAKVILAALAILAVLAATAREAVEFGSLPLRVDTIEMYVVDHDSIHGDSNQQMQRVEDDVQSVKCILVQQAKGESITECI